MDRLHRYTGLKSYEIGRLKGVGLSHCWYGKKKVKKILNNASLQDLIERIMGANTPPKSIFCGRSMSKSLLLTKRVSEALSP